MLGSGISVRKRAWLDQQAAARALEPVRAPTNAVLPSCLARSKLYGWRDACGEKGIAFPLNKETAVHRISLGER